MLSSYEQTASLIIEWIWGMRRYTEEYTSIVTMWFRRGISVWCDALRITERLILHAKTSHDMIKWTTCIQSN